MMIRFAAHENLPYMIFPINRRCRQSKISLHLSTVWHLPAPTGEFRRGALGTESVDEGTGVQLDPCTLSS
jgi:hypothetical protein